jgi:alginate O-acetyltransferase complex protein AlgI
MVGWIEMWTIALALFIGAKWITVSRWVRLVSTTGCWEDKLALRPLHRSSRRESALTLVWSSCQRKLEPTHVGCYEDKRGGAWALRHRVFIPRLHAVPGVGGGRLLAYALLWPGMDVRAFCASASVPLPPVREWVHALVKTFFGAAVLWLGVRCIEPTRPLLIGWTGMIAVVFLLHFGAFHLLSLLWRARGINARPIMQTPGMATSLGQFWGRRWNAAFADLMHEHFFKALARRLGPRRALLAIFVLSGLVHESVISLPARGGYGLPTLYFVAQGLGLLFERSKFGRAVPLGFGWKGWCFVVLVAGAPAFWLFHPIFVRNVILPMLHAIGAI